MTTLLLTPDLFTTDSGIPRILRLYLKAVVELGAPGDIVRFVSLNDAQVDSNDLRRYAHEDIGWEVCNRDKRTFIRGALRASAGANHIICGHVAQSPVAWLAKWLRPGLRYTIIAHGIEVWRPFTFLERRALKGARRVICVSDYTRQQVLKHCRLRPERVVVLPNALDPYLHVDLRPPVQGPLQPVILTVSRLSRADNYKGIDHLIEAMPAILKAEPAARLRIIGRGDDAPRLQSLARARGVQGAVEFAGFVSDTDLEREFAACRMFALPSQKEGFGLVYLEAMAQGKPCLGANEGGVPEVINAMSGRLVPFADVPAIAAACGEMLATDWDAEAIQKRALGEFGFETFKRNVQPLLQK